MKNGIAALSSNEDLIRKLTVMFSDDSERDAVMAILDTYGTERSEQEASRVRLAILKLAGSSRKAVEKYTAIAREDFRDILSWAEYPRQSRHQAMPEGPEKEKLIREDRAEYQAWLEK